MVVGGAVEVAVVDGVEEIGRSGANAAAVIEDEDENEEEDDEDRDEVVELPLVTVRTLLVVAVAVEVSIIGSVELVPAAVLLGAGAVMMFCTTVIAVELATPA